jgi:hypothetical protein
MKKRILVFPCGSEVGLEIHRAMQYSAHFELVGGSSVDDHGRFVYEEYVGDLPLHDAPEFAAALEHILRTRQIDAVFPAMDGVAEIIQQLRPRLGIRVIGSDSEATAICASKQRTMALLENRIPLPRRYDNLDTVDAFPIFIKPDRGYGSRHTLLAETPEVARYFLGRHAPGTMLLLEYLPGREWTVDCFSDRHRRLRFHGARQRNRIRNGISVNTTSGTDFDSEFGYWAETINTLLRPRGAWFFQARLDASGEPRLLEVGARPGGSSGLFRALGVNLPLLSAFDAFEQDVEIAANRYSVELDRALDNRFRLGLEYSCIYVDLDDCLICSGRLNHQLVGFLFKASSEGKRLVLLTRHADAPAETLHRLRLRDLFDEIVHITDGRPKSDHVRERNAIFIDDSHRERLEVMRRHHIPAFAPDMIEALM